MDFLEKDLEQIIWETSDDQLNNAGLYFEGKRFRQLRIGNYGVADLITVSRDYDFKLNEDYTKEIVSDCCLKITVYELKKDKIGISAFLQAINYCKGIKQYLEKRNFSNFYLSICLVGRTIDDTGSFIYLSELINITPDIKYPNGSLYDCSFFTYNYDFNGIKFKSHYGYKLSQEGF